MIESETTEQMEAFAPPPSEGNDPMAFWPTDQAGTQIPMDEWTVSDLGAFPDWAKGWLAQKLQAADKKPAVELLKELDPSQIAQNPRWANARLGEIARGMGIRAEYRG